MADIDEAVAGRLARAKILHRADKSCRLFAVIDEGVLRRPIGGPKVMADQIHAIVEACALPNVSITVVPTAVGAYPGLNGPMGMGAVDGQTVAFLDGPLGGQVTEDPDQIADLEEIWQAIQGYALPRRPSLELITEAANSWS